MSRLPTYEEVSAVLRVDVETGELWWNIKTGPRCSLKKPAGTVGKNGYRVVQINGRPYKAHRVVWLLTHGQWPKQEIDHINRRRDDNRPSNLRDVSKGENLKNNPFPNGLTHSGHRGVYLDKGRWTARAGTKYVGSFDTPEQARDAREKVLQNER